MREEAIIKQEESKDSQAGLGTFWSVGLNLRSCLGMFALPGAVLRSFQNFVSSKQTIDFGVQTLNNNVIYLVSLNNNALYLIGRNLNNNAFFLVLT